VTAAAVATAVRAVSQEKRSPGVDRPQAGGYKTHERVPVSASSISFIWAARALNSTACLAKAQSVVDSVLAELAALPPEAPRTVELLLVSRLARVCCLV
jgi:hypothetical protein